MTTSLVSSPQELYPILLNKMTSAFSVLQGRSLASPEPDQLTWPSLVINVATNNFEGCATAGNGAVRRTPEMIAPKFGFDFGPKFTTKKISTLALEFPNQIGNGNFGMNRNEKMNVIVVHR